MVFFFFLVWIWILLKAFEETLLETRECPKKWWRIETRGDKLGEKWWRHEVTRPHIMLTHSVFRHFSSRATPFYVRFIADRNGRNFSFLFSILRVFFYSCFSSLPYSILFEKCFVQWGAINWILNIGWKMEKLMKMIASKECVKNCFVRRLIFVAGWKISLISFRWNFI